MDVLRRQPASRGEVAVDQDDEPSELADRRARGPVKKKAAAKKAPAKKAAAKKTAAKKAPAKKAAAKKS
ncbi:hypothetical protein GS434_15835 [Rhodococcus hoagii]|nr:hypothetical protein [Prescottella equi]